MMVTSQAPITLLFCLFPSDCFANVYILKMVKKDDDHDDNDLDNDDDRILKKLCESEITPRLSLSTN